MLRAWLLLAVLVAPLLLPMVAPLPATASEHGVTCTDDAGGVWVAYYAIQRKTDGRWRANGCHLPQPTRTISA